MCSVSTQYGMKHLIDIVAMGHEAADTLVWGAFALLCGLVAADNLSWRVGGYAAHRTFVAVILNISKPNCYGRSSPHAECLEHSWGRGPREAALVLLIRAAADYHPAGSASFAAGGVGAVTQAMASAAQSAGAEIRTGADVIEIRVQNGKASGVVLSTGEEISAKAVISNADPKRTLLKLTDPIHLSPDFVQKLQHYRGNGTVAKVNLACQPYRNSQR